MAPPSIVTSKTFEPASVCFGPVEKNKMGGRFIPIVDKSGNKTRVTMQFPNLHLPFGISGYREKPEDEPASYSADLSFRGISEIDNVKILADKMNALDEHLIAAAHANSVAWFGKQKSRELLEDTYRRLTKVDASGKYPAILKTKIAMLNGKPNVQVFDIDKSPITIEGIPRGSSVKVIAELASIWQVGSGTSWGVTWRAIQILVTEKPNKLTEFAFVDDDDGQVEKVSEDEDMYDKFL